MEREFKNDSGTVKVAMMKRGDVTIELYQMPQD